MSLTSIFWCRTVQVDRKSYSCSVPFFPTTHALVWHKRLFSTSQTANFAQKVRIIINHTWTFQRVPNGFKGCQLTIPKVYLAPCWKVLTMNRGTSVPCLWSICTNSLIPGDHFGTPIGSSTGFGSFKTHRIFDQISGDGWWWNPKANHRLDVRKACK